MIDLSFTSTKHGRSHNQKILHSYKRRRRFLDSFEGTQIGSRKLLLKTTDYDDVRCKYLDGPEYENIIHWAWTVIGKTVDEAYSSFRKQLKGDYGKSALELFYYYTGIQKSHYWLGEERYISWTGLYVDPETGLLDIKTHKELRRLAYKLRKQPKKVIEHNLNTIKLDENIRKGITKYGKVYIIDRSTKKLIPGLHNVLIVPEDFTLPTNREKYWKLTEYLKTYKKVWVPGFPTVLISNKTAFTYMAEYDSERCTS